jgi:molybdate transport system substrate-binding protein
VALATIPLATVLGPGCTSDKPALLVFAAASTSGPLEEVGRAFEEATGDKVQFAFGATSELARQIRAGAPADVFVSADAAHMDELERAGLVDRAQRVSLLSNQLVVIAPSGSSLELSEPRALARVERLALADPSHVPAGLYAKQWLESLGLWDAVARQVIPALDVRAALAAVASGSAVAGIVYRTDAATSPAVRVVYTVDRGHGPAIVYAAAPLGRAKSPLARAFVSFLQGPRAHAAFSRAGFIVL